MIWQTLNGHKVMGDSTWLVFIGFKLIAKRTFVVPTRTMLGTIKARDSLRGSEIHGEVFGKGYCALGKKCIWFQKVS